MNHPRAGSAVNVEAPVRVALIGDRTTCVSGVVLGKVELGPDDHDVASTVQVDAIFPGDHIGDLDDVVLGVVQRRLAIGCVHDERGGPHHRRRCPRQFSTRHRRRCRYIYIISIN